MKRCFIFAALEVKQLPIRPENDFVIAADRGLENVLRLGFVPDVVIGDYDSLGYVPNGDNVVMLPVRKDDTDVGSAIKYALKKGFDRIIVYGALGDKLDHTFANIQLCSYAAENDAKMLLVGNDGTYVTAVKNGRLVLKNKKPGNRLSVFCSSGCACGVSITGAEYTLSNAALTDDFPLGVSNSFIENEDCEITVTDGTLTVIWEES